MDELPGPGNNPATAWVDDGASPRAVAIPAYRGQGVATVTASAFVEYCAALS